MVHCSVLLCAASQELHDQQKTHHTHVDMCDPAIDAIIQSINNVLLDDVLSLRRTAVLSMRKQ